MARLFQVKLIRASEPLAGTARGRPMTMHWPSAPLGSEAGARIVTSWSQRRNCAASWPMWRFTPLGTDQSYGETSAILIGRSPTSFVAASYAG